MTQENDGRPKRNEDEFRTPEELLGSQKLLKQHNRLIAVLVDKVEFTYKNAESIAELLSVGEMKKLRKILEQKIRMNPLCGKVKAKVIRRQFRWIWFNNFMRDWVENSYPHRGC